MTSAPLTIAPPPGPLQWLYPELHGFGPRFEVDLDLGSQPMMGAQILCAAREHERVLVAAGPRGDALARALRHGLRGATTVVVMEPAVAQLEPWFVQASGVELSSGRVMLRDGTWCGPGEVPDAEVGLAPIAPLHAEAVLDALQAANAERCIPVFLTSDDHPAEASTRLPESWWGLLPGDLYPEPLRLRLRQFLQRFWPERALRYSGYENSALAGLDLYEEALRGRFDEASAVRMTRDGMPWIIGLDGIDGAGKSTQIQALRSHLEQRGLRVAVHKIYRHGVFHDTVTDLTRQCAGDKHLHLWPMQRHIKLFDSLKYFYAAVEPSFADNDVLIFDRYVQTHHAAGLGRFGHDPYAREFAAVYPEADRVFLLDLPVEVAIERIERRAERTVDENPYMLSRYRAMLASFVDPPRVTMLDAQRPAAEITATISGSIDAMLEAKAQS